jgi:hypothetical protein
MKSKEFMDEIIPIGSVVVGGIVEKKVKPFSKISSNPLVAEGFNGAIAVIGAYLALFDDHKSIAEVALGYGLGALLVDFGVM